MRHVLESCRCDWCEEAFEFDEPAEEGELADALEAAGWVFAEKQRRHLDFCSDECAASWFGDARG
jgi:hypothetical protein